MAIIKKRYKEKTDPNPIIKIKLEQKTFFRAASLKNTCEQLLQKVLKKRFLHTYFPEYVFYRTPLADCL